MGGQKWPAFPAPSAPGQHPVEALTVESAGLGILGAAIDLAMADRIAQAVNVLTDRESWGEDDAARQEALRILVGGKP